MHNEIRQYLISAIEKKSRLPNGCNVESFNYIDSGHIDSIAVIKFILDIENHFKIDLTDDEIESPAFKTIGGLCDIIGAKACSR